MNIGTHPLPTLGQGQTVASEQVQRVNSPPPESGATAIEENEQSLTTERVLDELREDSKFKSPRRPTAVKTYPYTDAQFFFSPELLEFPTDMVQLRLDVQHRLQRLFEVAGLQKASSPDEAKSTATLPYYGRTTGPVKFVNQLLATWRLPTESACALLGFEPSRFSYVNDVLQGYETLTGRDAKDRIVHLIQIRTSLSALFRDETVENEWLREPHDTLNGKKPMDLLLEGSMENLLLVKEYVELVART